MAAPINTGAIAKLLKPGLNKVWGKEYTEHPVEYTDLFEVFTSDMNYEEDVMVPGFGLVPVKAQGSATPYTGLQQGPTSRYTHVAYGLGFIITREAIDDNKYEKAALGNTKTLAFSFRQTKEVVCANVYNRGFNSSYTGGDGVCLFSSAHPSSNGNFSNVIGTAADLSEASIEDQCINIMNATDDVGKKISLMPKKLIVPTAEVFNATRILRSTGQNDSANNAINALKNMNMFSDGASPNHYLNDTDAWFIRTNAPEGMKFFQRVAAEFNSDGDFDTDNIKYKGYERYSAGWTDPRGAWGSAGA